MGVTRRHAKRVLSCAVARGQHQFAPVTAVLECLCVSLTIRTMTHQSIVQDVDANSKAMFRHLQYVVKQCENLRVLARSTWLCLPSVICLPSRDYIDNQRVAMESLRQHTYNSVSVLTEERKVVEQVRPVETECASPC